MNYPIILSLSADEIERELSGTNDKSFAQARQFLLNGIKVLINITPPSKMEK